MKTRLLVLVALLAPSYLAAQRPDHCLAPVGIAALQCENCDIDNRRDEVEYDFRTEPTIVGIQTNSMAAGKLQLGDVLVSVGGYLITTREGGRRLVDLNPGDTTRISVRRRGREVNVTLVPTDCTGDRSTVTTILQPIDETRQLVYMLAEVSHQATGVDTSDVFDITPMVVRVDSASVLLTDSLSPAGSITLVMPIRTDVASPRPVVLALPPDSTGTFTLLRTPRAVRARGWLGFGLQCTETCYVPRAGDEDQTWGFAAHPRVHSVASGSPAEDAGILDGDVILTVDGIDITTEPGGRRFGSLAPREVVEFGLRRGNRELTVRVRVGYERRN